MGILSSLDDAFAAIGLRKLKGLFGGLSGT